MTDYERNMANYKSSLNDMFSKQNVSPNLYGLTVGATSSKNFLEPNTKEELSLAINTLNTFLTIKDAHESDEEEIKKNGLDTNLIFLLTKLSIKTINDIELNGTLYDYFSEIRKNRYLYGKYLYDKEGYTRTLLETLTNSMALNTDSIKKVSINASVLLSIYFTILGNIELVKQSFYDANPEYESVEDEARKYSGMKLYVHKNKPIMYYLSERMLNKDEPFTMKFKRENQID